LVTGCSTSATKTQINIVLKAVDVQPEDYPTIMGLKYMAKLLDEKTKDVSKWKCMQGATWRKKRNH